ncbi:MAG TPA: DUF1361 domain-containing protein [Firmicutes bacterium]|jgi:uncharacterized membrane protein|nr:DUF1361 domain-containing protein [Bacillota bacterium]
MRQYHSQISGVVVCSFAYFLISIPTFMLTDHVLHLALVWNLFLAVLPLLFAALVNQAVAKAKKAVFGLLWLLFFPNALYMITDFIHISRLTYYSRVDQYWLSQVVYSTDIIIWLKLVHIGLGALLGTLAGLLSLYIIHQLLLKKSRPAVAGLAIVASCVLAGYGIFIGRFLRLNSWDIFRPVRLCSQLINHTDGFAVLYTALFAAYILAAYGVFFVLFHRKGTEPESSATDPKQ